MKDGKNENEIRKMQEEENIFSAPSKDYGKRIMSEINKRIKVLPKEIKELFFESDTGTQKVINLLSIMGTDKLFLNMYTIRTEMSCCLGQKNIIQVLL